MPQAETCGNAMAILHVADADALLWSARPGVPGEFARTRELPDVTAVGTLRRVVRRRPSRASRMRGRLRRSGWCGRECWRELGPARALPDVTAVG
ncbi:hypothetical protein AB0J52_36410, partial [Spirillospora sp. NPDC049652]